MSIQVTGAGRRSRLSAALVALALAVAVLLLAIQARSIWSTKTGSQIQRVPANVAPIANTDLGKFSHMPKGCRVKVGCQHPIRKFSHMPKGCRVKIGCQGGGSTTERP
jgi:hypothetical protein